MYRGRLRSFSFLDPALLPLAPLPAFVVRFKGFQRSLGAQTALTGYLLAGTPIKQLALCLAESYRRLRRFACIAGLDLILGSRAVSASRPITVASRS